MTKLCRRGEEEGRIEKNTRKLEKRKRVVKRGGGKGERERGKVSKGERKKNIAKSDNWRFCWVGAENKEAWQREERRNLSILHRLPSFVCWFFYFTYYFISIVSQDYLVLLRPPIQENNAKNILEVKIW